MQMQCSYKSLQQHKVIVPKKDGNQYFDFQFPSRLFLTKKFKQPNEVGVDLIRIGVKMFFWRGRVFNRDDFQSMMGLKTVFICKNKQCGAKLVYHKSIDDQYMVCIVFKNLHRHRKSNDRQKSKKQEINQFIMHLRGEQYEKFRKIPNWVNKFDLTNAQSLYIVQQLYWYNNTEDETLATLAYQGNTVRRVLQTSQQGGKQKKQTVLIFVQTHTMKESYLQYGQTLTMQIYEQTIKKKRSSMNKNQAVGYFFCQDQNMKIVLVGVFLISKNSSALFKKLFQLFFQTNQQNLPFCIITDKVEEVTLGLVELKQQKKYNYIHLYPWYHIVPQIKAKLKSLQLKNGKDIMDLMCTAMQESNERIFYDTMCQLKTILHSNQQLFDQFIQYQKFYSYRRIPKIFSGFTISTKFGQQVLGQVRNSAVYRAHTGRLFHRLLKIETHLRVQASRITRVDQAIIKYCPVQINQLIDKVQKGTMDVLLQTYSSSKQHKKQNMDCLTIRVIEKQAREYIVKFLVEFDHWQCQCQRLILTGLPCSHLICVILDQKHKGSLLYYINSRWIHNKENGRPLNSIGPFISNRKRRP